MSVYFSYDENREAREREEALRFMFQLGKKAAQLSRVTQPVEQPTTQALILQPCCPEHACLLQESWTSRGYSLVCPECLASTIPPARRNVFHKNRLLPAYTKIVEAIDTVFELPAMKNLI